MYREGIQCNVKKIKAKIDSLGEGDIVKEAERERERERERVWG